MLRYSVVAASAALCAAGTLSAQTYDLFGTGCGSSAGALALHANGLPALGSTMQLELTQASPNSFAVLLFAASRLATPIDLAIIGSPGCLLYMLPDLSLGVPVSPQGAASVTFPVPSDPSMAGARVFNQWADVDLPSLHVSTSNAGVATLAPVPPGMNSLNFLGPFSGQVGTVVTFRIRDLGTTNPDDVCFRVADPATGAMSLFRVTGIVRDNMTGEDVVTARLATAAGQGPVRGQMGQMRGRGAQPPVNPSTCLSTPFSAWSWEGTSLPGADLMGPSPFTPMPSPTRFTVSFVYDAGSNSLYVDVPTYPFGNGGLYPTNAGVTTDAHGDLNCGGGVPGGHFDHCIETVSVLAACNNMTNQTLAIEHAPQVQQAFDNTFGAGRVTVTAETTGSLARIRITPTNPACTLTGGGGSLVITP